MESCRLHVLGSLRFFLKWP